jgi:hypothetical protein
MRILRFMLITNKKIVIDLAKNYKSISNKKNI